MEVLVLSSGYEPVARVPWERAVTLLFSGKVEVVEAYEDRCIRSVTLELRMPSVIRFLRGMRAFRKAVRFCRENVLARDGSRCQYCGRKVSRDEATYDHVVPRARGGITSWDNVVIACFRCNQKKGGRTPAEAGMKLLAAPAKPKALSGTRLTLAYDKGIPLSWRKFVRDAAYWQVKLDE
jgi:5-methylcytosine-specific restriction endonuclease McrA